MKSKRSRAGRGKPTIAEAEETLHAIRRGAVDAFVVEEPDGHRVYALNGVDLPYSVLVERMQQGAAMVDEPGAVIYSNASLEQLLGVPHEAVIGAPIHKFLEPADQPSCQKLLRDARYGASEGELRVRRADGTLIPAHFSCRLLSRDKSAVGVLVTDLTVQKQQANLASRLQRSQDEERRRIARELHDSVGQLLVALALNVAVVKKESHKLNPETAKLIDENAAMINEISDEIRTISHLLHPPLLDEVGLASALRWYIDGFAERSKIQASVEIPKTLERLPQETEIAIFRAVQECLTNVHRHADSASCAVKVVQDAKGLWVEIKDSGRGIPQAKKSSLSAWGGVGLRGMQERIRQLGGTLEVQSGGNGTTVTAAFPRSPSGNTSVDVA